MSAWNEEFAEALPRRAWILCGLLFAATALSFLDRQVLSVLASSISADLGMSNTDYGRVVFAFTLSYTIMFFLGGWLVDRLGTVWGLALAVGVWSLSSVGHALVTSALGLGLMRLLLGLGEGPCFPAATKGATEWFPPEKRGLAVGIAIGGSAFGALLAPPLTAWLAADFGWRGAFLATGTLGFVWLAAWIIAGRDAGALVRQKPKPVKGSSRVVWENILKTPATWRILGARFLFDPVFYFFMFWIPKYLADERGFSLEKIGAYYWIPFLALGISNIVGGQLGDLLIRGGWTPRTARRSILTCSALVTPLSCAVIFTPSTGWAIALLTLLLAAHGLWICTYLALISDHYPAGVIATIVGLTGSVGGIAGMIANLATGPIVDRHGFTPIFLGTACLYPLALLVLLSIPRRPGDFQGKADGLDRPDSALD